MVKEVNKKFTKRRVSIVYNSVISGIREELPKTQKQDVKLR